MMMIVTAHLWQQWAHRYTPRQEDAVGSGAVRAHRYTLRQEDTVGGAAMRQHALPDNSSLNFTQSTYCHNKTLRKYQDEVTCSSRSFMATMIMMTVTAHLK
eukprot:TRINITY_DN68545_c0_g1_i5.p1 TRINITY_DN68545_c0_g1~~TRINITY_DN68545_c0_g1_i5.p1  ORF type:complete len:101 (+),score=11.48 TRINITY_DN68545_c0_g1_i5:66-368(+)